MKVTVCFGNVRVVVPCGNGDLLVRDLIHEATRRYKKAAGKDPDAWTVVHHLQTQSGGILDSDDQVNDVADDRELIVATFDDAGPDPGVAQGGGDGASGSSVGTGSPDIFYAPSNDSKYVSSTHEPNDNVDNVPHIEVTETNQSNSSGLGLQVRRSSDPSMHQIGIEIPNNRSPIVNNLRQYNDATKRWSAAPVCRSDTDQPEQLMADSDKKLSASQLTPSWESESEVENFDPHQHKQQQQQQELQLNHLNHNESMPTQFSRSGRLSMQFLGDGNGYKWIDAAEKAAEKNSLSYNSKSLPRELKRKEPLGQAYESIREKNGKMLLIINENRGSLGLRAIPDPINGGLLVQNVDKESPAERGGLQRGDRILEINGFKLIGLSESSIQDYLRQNIAAPELRLRVIKTTNLIQKLKKEIDDMVEAEEKQNNVKNVNVSPSRKVPGALSSNALALQMANKRKIGRKIEIELCKGPQGLGFSVTTRDHQTGGESLIYIKKILSIGAAIEDGRLRPGDRLLEVDNVTMTGKSQSEVVEILRSTKPGSKVGLVVSRQQDLSELSDDKEIICEANIEQELDRDKTTPPKPPPPVLPQKPCLKPSSKKSIDLTPINQQNLQSHMIDIGFESASSNESAQSFPWRNREILTLHIPVNDTEKAGLGVSVKGKTSSQNSSNESNNSRTDGDLGIFVKSVLKGGAASRDGRLKMNDQLLNVNGVSLLGQSNAEAMTTLRKTMVHMPGKYPKMITLQVARRITRPNSTIETLDISNTSTSSASEQSGKTVIYLSPDKNEKIDISHLNKNSTSNSQRMHNRWSNPVLDRLTGGVTNQIMAQKTNGMPQLIPGGLRNDSYYMATNESWSPMPIDKNNSVLIEDDQEPLSPIFAMDTSINRMNESKNSINQQVPVSPSSPNPCETTYSSQLSLETNPPIDPFSRDAIGRRSMSEKHHAALDAKETGTYQRNKKLREERERRSRANTSASLGSMESIVNVGHNISKSSELSREALDRITDLGPSLGMKKSSSLESLQTIVQEIQMSDEPRGPSALRTPRGRGRDEFVRAEVERPSRKHWLLEENSAAANVEHDEGFINRHGPFQSSLNEGKNKRVKKPGLLRGIGHMFRFGKHRKDGIAPTGDALNTDLNESIGNASAKIANKENHKTIVTSNGTSTVTSRTKPPNYQPPPPVAVGIPVGNSNGIHQNDVFNHRYSHYVNYDELQQQISPPPQNEQLSESTLAQMRQQVMQQRFKVEEESRRHQHYHSQRSTRTVDLNSHPQRPASTYYEYETLHYNGIGTYNPNATSPAPNFNHHIAHNGSQRKILNGQSPMKWRSPNGSANNSIGGSIRSRGPFVTQIAIREHPTQQPSGHIQANITTSASKV